MAAYASLVSLMHLIHDLENHPSPPISLDKQQVEYITQHIAFFQEFLESYNPPLVANNEEEAADPLEMRIASAAYAAEDFIESYIVDRLQLMKSYFCSQIEPNLRRVIKEMDSIKKAVDLKVKTEKKALLDHNQIDMTNDLGSGAFLLKIMEKFTGARPDQQVNPTVGMGGIGYEALASLMQVINDLEQHPSPPVPLDKQQVNSITQHITFFQEFLQSYNPPLAADNAEEAADPLEMRIAGAAYAAEDAIESHIVGSLQNLRSNFCSKIVQILNCFRAPKAPSLCHVIKEMDSIEKVVDVKAKTKKKALVDYNQVGMTNDLASIAPKETIAGSDAVLLEIMEQLTGDRPDFQVIPIVGMGGIGKTFLARSVYARTLIKEHFYICAWVTFSQQYNTGEILLELLSQATKIETKQLRGKSVDELGSELHKTLFGRRFLIVMDDIWSIDAWDNIQRFFPKNCNGSRVLVTTRLSQLSSQLNNNDYSHNMSFLDKASSWNLFSKTVFGEKSSCHPELEEIGEKIVENCRGLPLSIAVVGGLLKTKNVTRAYWESVRDNFTSVVNMNNDKHCLRLLKLSYNHLPVYLKPCFLYMGVFEEDENIRVSKLVHQWVSEGFLNPTNGEALDTIARGFLQDLIDRNLILIDELGTTGSLKLCKIHDLVRDMCLKEGQKEGFYYVMGKRNPRLRVRNTKRRVIIPRNTSNEKVCDELRSMQHARSVICEYHMLPPRQKLRLLRTLHANVHDYVYNGHVISLACRFVNLRHLAIITESDMSSFFPSAGLHWNLHTLIVSCSPNTYCLVDFWKMPQFRHIEFTDECLGLPDTPNDGDAMVVMENLHTLKGVINFKCCEDLVKRLPNIKRLKLEYPSNRFDEYNEHDEYCAGNIKSLCRLESLSILVEGSAWHHIRKLTFPHSLRKLTLETSSVFDLEDGILETIGSLPFLEKLRLYGGRFTEGELKTVEGQFPCLRHLELGSCQGLIRWTAAEEGSSILPRLEHIRLLILQKLKTIPNELGNIDTLKSIELIDCGEGSVKSAKEMVDEQVELQGFEQISLYVEGSLGRYTRNPMR